MVVCRSVRSGRTMGGPVSFPEPRTQLEADLNRVIVNRQRENLWGAIEALEAAIRTLAEEVRSEPVPHPEDPD